MVDLKNFRIPLEEIKLATDNFNPQRCIGGGTSGKVYKGQLQRYGNRTVAIKRHDPVGSMVKNDLISELQIVSTLYHPNIVTCIGYCEEDNEMIMVYEHAMNGSLDHHLYDENKSYARLRWAQRLKICIGAAKGLEYLHSGLEDNHRLIHRNIKSSIILLNENLEAKISGFCLSVLVPGNQRHTQAYTGAAGTWNSIISESSILMQEKKDIYAFGVLLFEMLSGMWDYSQRKITDYQPQNLITFVRSYYDQGLDKLIDPYIRNYIDSRSLNKFNEIAHKCISFNIKDRPSISFIIKTIQEALDIHQQESLEEFLIPLENINKATSECIGEGGYGKVYKGKLPGCWKNRTVAIKFMTLKVKQAKKVFLNELKLISSCHHQNIIPFIGYCDEGGYMIMVFEYAINGSLDDHLEKPDKRRWITWEQRLKICLGVAKGINYLHSGRGVANRVIHRDLKSGNILLDENMEAKICDFGLARSDPDNELNAPIQTSVAGTRYYTDPAYHECGRLVKESDVYSFGVVMFELLTGMMAYQYKLTGAQKRESLISLVRGCYKDGFHELIDPYIIGHADSRSIDIFNEIAYSCIVLDTAKRPTMELVIKRIEEALNIQVSISTLTDYFTKGKGIMLDKPIAAFNIYKCLLLGKCFDDEKCTMFNWLIWKIDKDIKKEDDNDYTVYWFSNTLILLYYIRESVKHDDGSSGILFKQQLISLVESLYHIICGYFKEKMESLLTLSIVAPTTSKLSDEEEEDSQYVYESSDNEDSEYTSKMSDDEDSQSNDWNGIVDLLNTILNTLKENFVPPVIVQEIFGQLFSLINAHLFNRVLLYPEYCTYINAIYFRDGLDTLEKWCLQTTEEYARGTMGKLQHLREVVALLIYIKDIRGRSHSPVTINLYPCLSQRQLDGICTLYREEDGSRGAAIQVISRIKYLVIQNSNREGSASFYLTNNYSKPILVNDILKLEGFLGAKLEAELAKYPPVNFIND